MNTTVKKAIALAALAILPACVPVPAWAQFSAEVSAEPVWVQMDRCEYEDGNPDGSVCLWVDPDTGEGYVNDSQNYRA